MDRHLALLSVLDNQDIKDVIIFFYVYVSDHANPKLILICCFNKQLLDEVEHDIMKPKAEADNTDTRF